MIEVFTVVSGKYDASASVVKTLCLIGQPTLPESETDQSVLCLMNRVS